MISAPNPKPGPASAGWASAAVCSRRAREERSEGLGIVSSRGLEEGGGPVAVAALLRSWCMAGEVPAMACWGGRLSGLPNQGGRIPLAGEQLKLKTHDCTKFSGLHTVLRETTKQLNWLHCRSLRSVAQRRVSCSLAMLSESSQGRYAGV